MKTYIFFLVMLSLFSSCQENPLGSKPKAGSNFHPGLGAPPRITSISPNQGSIIGGTNITISGTGFTPDSVIKIGGYSCAQTTYNSSTRIVCLTSSSTVGTKNISVLNKDKQGHILPQSFTFIQESTGAPGFGVVSGGKRSTSASHMLQTTVGEPVNGQVMTGTTTQMRVGVQGILFE